METLIRRIKSIGLWTFIAIGGFILAFIVVSKIASRIWPLSEGMHSVEWFLEHRLRACGSTGLVHCPAPVSVLRLCGCTQSREFALMRKMLLTTCVMTVMSLPHYAYSQVATFDAANAVAGSEILRSGFEILRDGGDLMTTKLWILVLTFAAFGWWWGVMAAVTAGSVHVEHVEQWSPPPLLGLPPAA